VYDGGADGQSRQGLNPLLVYVGGVGDQAA